ncbi:hypothetical protein G5I_13814 [Acromyrmex echinatior]|uniref:Uncharacterized protein n=1 Tax=Acromyrmex echinatior TaxID=103372 RepID=F4X618_ACREC|nr:hypothetical protein G5I_13814 [Acromyrmex echinatior]
MCAYDTLQMYLHQANKPRDIGHPQGSPLVKIVQLPNYYRKFKVWRARELRQDGTKNRTSNRARISVGKVAKETRKDGPQLGKQRVFICVGASAVVTQTTQKTNTIDVKSELYGATCVLPVLQMSVFVATLPRERMKQATTSTGTKLSTQLVAGYRLGCKLEPLSVSSTSGANAIRNLSGRTQATHEVVCISLRRLGVVRLHVTQLAKSPQNCTGALELLAR